MTNVYNLLVQLDHANSAWSNSQRFRIDRGRVFEYSEDTIRSKLNSNTRALKELPCLFSYEGFDGSGRVEHITSIRELGPSSIETSRTIVVRRL